MPIQLVLSIAVAPTSNDLKKTLKIKSLSKGNNQAARCVVRRGVRVSCFVWPGPSLCECEGEGGMIQFEYSDTRREGGSKVMTDRHYLFLTCDAGRTLALSLKSG